MNFQGLLDAIGFLLHSYLFCLLDKIAKLSCTALALRDKYIKTEKILKISKKC